MRSLKRVGDVARQVVASDADGIRRREIPVMVYGVSGRAAAHIQNERAVALLGIVQDGVCRAGDGEQGVAQFEIRFVCGRSCVVDPVRVAVDVQGVEPQHSAAHSLWRGYSAERVKAVCLIYDLERFAVFGQNHHLAGAFDFLDVSVGDLGAFNLDAGAVRVDLHMLPRDDEKSVSDVERIAAFALALFLVDGSQDAFYGLGGLLDVQNLAFAHSGGFYFGVLDHFKPFACLGLAYGQYGMCRAELYCGVYVGHRRYSFSLWETVTRSLSVTMSVW